MIVFPNCKINLGLHVVQKRNDGFHDIETVFYPVPVKDVLEIVQSGEGNQGPEVTLTIYGLPVKGDTADNLCVKAYRLIKNDFPELPAIQIYLLKNIPIGAGLGGGSADGAFMLKMLNDKFHLNLSSEQLINYALQLGSDCPFFINNQPCYATGRGEILEPVKLNLSGYQLILVNPGIHINTGLAFSQLNLPDTTIIRNSVKQIIQQSVAHWKNILINDFENDIFQKHPEIKAIKDRLYDEGAVYAAMSGSGSTVFALFQNYQGGTQSFSSHYTVVNL